MTIGLLHAVSALLSRAARKLSRRRSSVLTSDDVGTKKKDGKESFGGANEVDRDGELGEDGVWRRTILMGEKCQPLDFSGVIYYDNDGRRLAEVPTPRSPLRSPLPSFAVKSPVAAAAYVS
ncbi:hypothetical protein Cni_G11605 [Canna indica]|uniref:Uncharacterized protein n=1 Tax=Canna indica TaxID=4628 RepID=A0AAQ3Q8B5_9LILI|nr:hypothetical protein Cni_G11605 [Canna indica]